LKPLVDIHGVRTSFPRRFIRIPFLILGLSSMTYPRDQRPRHPFLCPTPFCYPLCLISRVGVCCNTFTQASFVSPHQYFYLSLPHYPNLSSIAFFNWHFRRPGFLLRISHRFGVQRLRKRFDPSSTLGPDFFFFFSRSRNSFSLSLQYFSLFPNTSLY